MIISKSRCLQATCQELQLAKPTWSLAAEVLGMTTLACSNQVLLYHNLRVNNRHRDELSLSLESLFISLSIALLIQLTMATATATRFVLPGVGLLGLAYTLPRPVHHRCESDYSTSQPFTSTFSFLSPSNWRLFRAPRPPPPPPPTAIKTTFNPVHYRQISTGSFLGLFMGLAMARFSRPLAAIVGLLVCIIEVG